MADPVIVVQGRGDFSQLNRALGQADSSVGRSTGSWKRFGSVVKSGALAAAAGAAAVAAVGFKLAQGAAEDEQAQVKLATALKNTTGARARDIAGVEKYITAQGKALGVTDDELRPALGQLAAATGSVTKAQKLASLALDVSAGRGVALSSVTKALEKAQNGTVTSLGKLGVKTKDAEGKTRSLQAITADLARTYRGQASAAAETTAGKYTRLRLSLDELGESIGARLLPFGQKLADLLLDDVVPAADALFRAFERNGVDGLVRKFDKLTGINLGPYLDDIKRAGEGVTRIFEALSPAFGRALESIPPFLSPLQLLADVLGVLANVAEAIPEPVKDLGIQAGIAAAILPALTRNATLAGNAIFTAGGRAAVAAGIMTRLGGAARGAAGIAGLLALSQGFKQTGDDAKSFGDALQSTGLLVGGGAAAGFSIGGPVGALVGALAGAGAAILGTRDKTNELDSALQQSKQVVVDYAGSFDQLTGAVTRSTRELVLQEIQKAGIISSANLLGVSTRDLIDATLGQGNAAQRVREQLSSYDGVLENLTANKVREFLVGATGEFSRQQREAILAADALSTYRERLLGVPRKVVVALRQAGFPEGKRQVDNILSAYKLTPREIKTVYRALGVDTTKRQAGDLRKTLEGVGKVAPRFNPLIEAITGGLNQGQRRGRAGARQITGDIERETGKARPKFQPFTGAIPGALSPARGAASRGGVSIGDALENGVVNGFSGTAIRLSNMAAAAVSQAIAAGKRAGRIQSPSKETEYLGKMLGDGLALGMERRTPKAAAAGRRLILSAIAGVVRGSDGIGGAIEKLNDLIEKQVNLKNDKAERARERAIIRGLRDEYALLKDNGKAQDRNTARLEKARDAYKNLVSEAKAYAQAIKDGVVSNASVVGLGAGEDGTGITASGIAAGLNQKRQETIRFYQAILKLRGKLNATSLQQILDAGVQGGLGTAEALAAGTSAELAQINAFAQQIADVGGELGSKMRDKFKSAGISAAAGLVEGLEREQKRLDKAAERIGATIVRAIKNALGIKSPSRVLRAVGDEAMAGLALGLDETYARRLGAAVGAGVVGGVGRPTLTLGAAGSGATAVDPAVLLLEQQNDLLRRLLSEATGTREATEAAPGRLATAVGGGMYAGMLEGVVRA